jgi:hypothetical protein
LKVSRWRPTSIVFHASRLAAASVTTISSVFCLCRLNGPSLEIVERCDGKHTVQQIILDLQKIYSKAEPHKVESDILGYLALLHDQRALDFEL